MVLQKKGKVCKPQNMIPTVTHGGENNMFWGYFSSRGTGKLMKIKGIIRKELYLNIIDENVWWSAKEINLA